MTVVGYHLTAETLIKEASYWDGEADNMQQMAHEALALDLTRFDSGPFQLITSVHAQVVATFVSRSQEGCQEMHRIADALRKTAENYDIVERDAAQSFQALHK